MDAHGLGRLLVGGVALGKGAPSGTLLLRPARTMWGVVLLHIRMGALACTVHHAALGLPQPSATCCMMTCWPTATTAAMGLS